MSQITRKSTLVHGRIGHYEFKGPIYTKHNYGFAEMAYGGTLNLFFVRGDPATIRKKNVEDAYRALQRTHPLLSRYDMPKLTFSLVNYHVSENKKHVSIDKGWLNNALFANEDVNPQATDVQFKDLIIGEDNVGKMVRYSHPSFLALIFPYLFTTYTGHYSMVPQNVEDFNKHSGIYGIPENQGEVSQATMNLESLSSHTRKRLLIQDRRFARDPSFLLFMLNLIEKRNIAAANRFVVSTKGRNNLRQSDVVNPVTGKINKNIVSTVPSQIRSSYAYKRKNFGSLMHF
ncbi:hypothetical protein G6F43_012763 [Rhizopus delemar]|nr:hypothetical protein G6F43_012763 [Rhizopus delemar]